MKKITGAILAMLLTALLLNACGPEEENAAAESPGQVETVTTEAAAVVVKRIRTPLDKARATQNLGDQRVEEMDTALQEQQ
jgi:hypothetical protein